jgi:5-deoxy-D-glucuronate isomerase
MSPVFDGSNGPLRDLSVYRLRLGDDVESWDGRTGDTETVLHVLVGSCTVRCVTESGELEFFDVGEREDVFSAAPTTVILPPGTSYSVVKSGRSVDLAVGSVVLPEYEGGQQPSIIRPQDVFEHHIGEAHFSRTVREVIGGEGRALRIRLGETINPVGQWSSWPHHDFDADPELAPLFEEVFLYFTKPRDGWGLQRRDGLYCDLQSVDDVIVVNNGDAAIVPLGEHPLVAGVDSSVLYVWFYLSPIPKTYSRWAEDVGGYA